MHIRKYLPSLGFVILFVTIVFCFLFVNWALGPLSYEKAQYEEQKGHQLTQEGKYAEASTHFLRAAEIEDDNISRSRRYRCAGTTSADMTDKIKYFELALKFNPENGNALHELERINKVEFVYIGRYPDGWSKGRVGKLQITTRRVGRYSLTYFTSSPEQIEFIVTVSLKNKILEKKKIISGQVYTLSFSLPKGEHDILISINNTFNPEKLKMSADKRDLGIHYVIDSQENLSE